MGKRNSTSKEHLSRNSVSNARHTALHEAIETERGRLSQAQSILECMRLALENADTSDAKNPPYYPDVLEVALALVGESVNRLDSVYIRPLVEAG